MAEWQPPEVYALYYCCQLSSILKSGFTGYDEVILAVADRVVLPACHGQHSTKHLAALSVFQSCYATPPLLDQQKTLLLNKLLN